VEFCSGIPSQCMYVGFPKNGKLDLLCSQICWIEGLQGWRLLYCNWVHFCAENPHLSSSYHVALVSRLILQVWTGVYGTQIQLAPLSNVVGGKHDRNTLIWVQSISQKHLMLPLRVMLQLKQWYFLCITHTTGGALTGGNSLKVFLDGELVASGKLK
jgi:hypothetical protein